MAERRARILMLVEGPKTDVNLMTHLLDIYGIGDKYEIVSYNTNIYVLYNALFAQDDQDALDLLQVLKEREKDENRKALFDEHYSDILLIFDLDPQDALYSEEKIVRLLEYFSESSDNGKLYLNYPMVESFYHMKSIPDPEYYSYVSTIEELKERRYKQRVQRESRNSDYRKFACNREECSQVIVQNLKKARIITHMLDCDSIEAVDPIEVFSVQAEKIRSQGVLYVLCTCSFYVYEYNPKLILEY